VTETKIGKIQKVSFGIGGYQDAMIGIDFTLGSSGWGVCDHTGFWGSGIEVTDNTKWTEADRDAEFSELVRYIDGLLVKAKVKTVEDLKDIPVEVTFERNTLKSWRILEEVL